MEGMETGEETGRRREVRERGGKFTKGIKGRERPVKSVNAYNMARGVY